MAATNVIGMTRTGTLKRALRVNSRAGYLSQDGFRRTGTEPVNSTDITTVPLVDGIFGESNEITHNNIKVYPISQGQPDGQYWINIWGWNKLGSNPSETVWIPCILATLFCVAGTENGFAHRLIREDEYFAGLVQVYQGAAQVVYGGVPYAVVSLLGCPKHQFDIAMGDPPALGNALWGYFS